MIHDLIKKTFENIALWCDGKRNW